MKLVLELISINVINNDFMKHAHEEQSQYCTIQDLDDLGSAMNVCDRFILYKSFIQSCRVFFLI